MGVNQVLIWLCVRVRLALFVTAIVFFRYALINQIARITFELHLHPKLSFFTIQSSHTPRFPYVQHVILSVRYDFSVVACSTAVRTRILHILMNVL